MSALDCLASKQALVQQPRWATPEVCGGLTHKVYGLLDCPELEACTFVFSRRSPFDDHEILLAGDLDDDAPSLNLATLRRLGANLDVRLGDLEVHIFQEAKISQEAKIFQEAKSVKAAKASALSRGEALRANRSRCRQSPVQIPPHPMH